MPFYQVQCGGNVIMLSNMRAARKKADELTSGSGVQAMVLECDIVYVSGAKAGRKADGVTVLGGGGSK